ncbi:MAG: YicC family protein [Planctomycetota bacterium]
MSRKTEAASPAEPVRSMTGYGRAVDESGAGRCVVEIRSVNGRFLKLGLKLPPRLGALEEKVKAVMAQRGVRRGSVDVGIYLDDAAKGQSGYSIDVETVRRYADQFKTLSKVLKRKSAPPLDTLLSLPGSVIRTEAEEDLEGAWERLERGLSAALNAFDGMRRAEGLAMAADIRAQLAVIAKHRAALLELAPAAQRAALERLRERVQKLLAETGNSLELGKATLEREIVMLADRMDVSEELARLESHLKQMNAALEAGGELGKKLDFLTQELNREVNTIGSKANDEAVTHAVVEMKQAIEKIREQVQNLE